VPTLRTIERVLQRAHLTSPRLRFAHHLPRSEYPGPRATDSNQVHQVDLVGPRYLTGDKTKYYFYICKDAFDQAVYAEFHAGNAAELVLSFLIAAWQHLGLPQQVQFDNGRQFYAPGRYARSLNRVIRLTVRLGVQPVFIPDGQPARNGSVENFNGWFQPLLLRQNFPNARAVQRELRHPVTAANEQHVHQALGFKTPLQFRHAKRLRMLPANFAINLNKIPVSVGKILFIRWVGVTGFVDVLGQSVRVGRRFRYHYVKVLLETHPQRLRIYCNARLIKSCEFKLRIP